MFGRIFYGTTYSANAAYQRAATTLLAFILADLGLLWVAAGWDLRWLAVGTMIVGGFVITVAFWQPFVGGILSLGEFIRVKDDPNKKGVLNAFLLMFISLVVAGNVAIILGVIDSGEMFPYWILGILVAVAGAVVLGGTHLDVWLPRITKMTIGLAIAGTLVATDPLLLAWIGIDMKAWEVKESQRSAKRIADRDKEVQDTRQNSTLLYLERLQNCALSEKERTPFNEQQVKAYDAACSSSSSAVTLEEVRQHWPGLHKVWQDSQIAVVGGKGATIFGATMLLAHLPWILGALGIGGLGWFALRKKNTDSADEPAEKAEEKKDAKKVKDFPTKTVLAIAALAGGVYFWPSIGPVVQNIPTQARQLYEENAPAYFNTRQPRLGVITPENVRFWRASPNFNVGLTLDPIYSAGAGVKKELTLSGRTEIFANSIIANGQTVAAPSGKMFVTLVAEPAHTSIVLGGPSSSCVIWSDKGERCVEHRGAWQSGKLSGTFKWRWSDSLMTAKIYLFTAGPGGNPIAEFTVRFASELQ